MAHMTHQVVAKNFRSVPNFGRFGIAPELAQTMHGKHWHHPLLVEDLNDRFGAIASHNC